MESFGKTQRETLRERQDHSLQRFFPTPAHLQRQIERYKPTSVLDIGCGYGRFLEPLAEHFNIQGTDIATDLLQEIPDHLQAHVFQLNIVSPPPGWTETHIQHWDVSYAWAVFMYFINDPESMASAMKNAEAITRKKIIVWDWKHVCDYMRTIHPSDKFEYHYIPLIAG